MSVKSENILVIGGGVIGLFAARELAKAGFQVTVVERDPSLSGSCSMGNAGMVVPSHFVPLAAPGVISQGLRWMLDPKSPFYLRPRLDISLARWCWEFFRHANARHVRDSEGLLRDLGLESRRLFHEVACELGVDLVERGLMMYCLSEKGLEEESAVAARANQLGVGAEVCGRARIVELDPGVETNAIGGVWFPQDAHLDPRELLESLQRDLRNRGVVFELGEVVGFHREGDKVRGAKTSAGEIIGADQVVIAAGVWTEGLARDLRLKLPMQGGKGYSLTLENPRKLPSLCSLLKEGRVAVTPMGERLRVAGTMEICGNDLSISHKRVQGVVDSFCRFFPQFKPQDFEGIDAWSGLRPCSPDGLPYLGKHPGHDNVILATGHSMMGLSLAPITGVLVSELAQKKDPSIRIGKLAPGRFG